MRKRTIFTAWLLTACFLIAFTGCAKQQQERDPITIPSNAATMEVDFSWEGVAACSQTSPQIRVSGVPKGTAYFRVRLINLSQPEWNHGGGRMTHDGSGIIPEGALVMGYNGPCPPKGERNDFEFMVIAMDKDDAVLGVGRADKSFANR